MDQFRGTWPALVTPRSADGDVNESVLRHLVEYLIAKGVDGFYIGGTTGEGIFMPVTHRKKLAEIAIQQINGRVPSIIHVGAVALDDAKDLARHAQQHGANGISSVLPPIYNSIGILTAYYTELAQAVPELPIYVYLLDPTLDAVAFMQALMNIPNLGGVKYTGSNMYEFRRIIDLGEDKWTTFSGMDEQCLYALMMGATGSIGSTLNIMPGVYQQIRLAVLNGKYALAQDLQLRANRVTEAMTALGFQGALYEVLKTLGFDCGIPRLPRIPLNEKQRQTLHAALEQTGFKELSQM